MYAVFLFKILKTPGFGEMIMPKASPKEQKRQQRIVRTRLLRAAARNQPISYTYLREEIANTVIEAVIRGEETPEPISTGRSRLRRPSVPRPTTSRPSPRPRVRHYPKNLNFPSQIQVPQELPLRVQISNAIKISQANNASSTENSNQDEVIFEEEEYEIQLSPNQGDDDETDENGPTGGNNDGMGGGGVGITC